MSGYQREREEARHAERDLLFRLADVDGNILSGPLSAQKLEEALVAYESADDPDALYDAHGALYEAICRFIDRPMASER